MGVRNPFISFFLVCDQVYDNPADRLVEFLGKAKAMYEDAKRAFEEMGELGWRRHFGNIYRNEYGEHSKTATAEANLDTFFSMADYT